MKCESAQELLPELVAGGLPPEDEKSLRLHLADCTKCKKEEEKQKILLSGLRHFYGSFDPGKKPVVIPEDRESPAKGFPSPEPATSRNMSIFFWIPAFAIATILVFMFVFPFSRENRPPKTISGPSGQIPERAEAQTYLQFGILLDQTKNGTWKKGASLPISLPFEAVEESSIEHLKRMVFTVAKETRFELSPDGIKLGLGGAQFEVKPGETHIKVRTPSAVLGVMGTKFDVIVRPQMTVVHLKSGKVMVGSEKENLIMGPLEVVIAHLGSAPRKIDLPEPLWQFFQNHPRNWDSVLLQRIGSKLSSPKIYPPKTVKPPVSSASTEASESANIAGQASSSTETPVVSPASESGETIIGSASQDLNNPEEAMNDGM